MSIKSKRRQAAQQPAESFEAYGEYQYTYQPQEEAANAAEAAERAKIAHAKRKNHLFFRFLLQSSEKVPIFQIASSPEFLQTSLPVQYQPRPQMLNPISQQLSDIIPIQVPESA